MLPKSNANYQWGLFLRLLPQMNYFQCIIWLYFLLYIVNTFYVVCFKFHFLPFFPCERVYLAQIDPRVALCTKNRDFFICMNHKIDFQLRYEDPSAASVTKYDFLNDTNNHCVQPAGDFFQIYNDLGTFIAHVILIGLLLLWIEIKFPHCCFRFYQSKLYYKYKMHCINVEVYLSLDTIGW